MNSVSSYRGKTNKQTDRKLNGRLFFKVILRFYLANGTHSLCFNLCFGSPQTPERTIKTLNFTFFILNLAWLTLGMCVFSFLGWFFFFFFCLKAFWTTAQCGMSGYKNKCDLRQLWIMSLQSEAYSVNSIFTLTKLFFVAYKAKLSQHAFLGIWLHC